MLDGVKSVNSRVKYAIFDFYFKVQNDMVSGTCITWFSSSDLFLDMLSFRYEISHTHTHTLITL